MLSAGTNISRAKKPLFLTVPSQLPELNDWIADYIQRRERFTFEEQDVLANLWQEGEDIRLREDERFKQILPQEGIEVQWHLTAHSIANQHLYELLLDELWDGYNLFQCLEDCDREDKTSFHLFCPKDPRFHLYKDENDIYCIKLFTEKMSITLTEEQKIILDQLMPQLCSIMENDNSVPYTTTRLLELLARLSTMSNDLVGMLPQNLESWLLHQKDWVRVGRDSWLLKNNLPTLAGKHRYAVSPVLPSSKGSEVNPVRLISEYGLDREATQIEDETTEPEEATDNQTYTKWRIVLKTCHINEGFIPVPKQAHALYPHALKLADVVAIPGIWVTEGRGITAWLDRKKHSLFGPDLEEQFTFVEAGTILEIKWKNVGLIFNTLHIDIQIAGEEMRLIDLTSLSHSRSHVLESYRMSMYRILKESPVPLNFHDLYKQVCTRQRHKPNSSTIRSILSSSPEFIFDKETKKWMLNTASSIDIGAKVLRNSVIFARQTEDTVDEAFQETPSLAQMIVRNRQRLTTLRSIYLLNKEDEI